MPYLAREDGLTYCRSWSSGSGGLACQRDGWLVPSELRIKLGRCDASLAC